MLFQIIKEKQIAITGKGYYPIVCEGLIEFRDGVCIIQGPLMLGAPLCSLFVILLFNFYVS